ncbi:RNA 2',3'-cyclic phosphate--5'-hydroxyl ligase [Achromatium sp. WMS3]|nr:RNA 2',3'-cyclic phosphate--5'-hydroxyl ligase [Achromatium sp. WMS3]
MTGKILKLHQWPEGKIIGIAKKIGNQLIEQGLERDIVLERLNKVQQNPESFQDDPILTDIACEFIRIKEKEQVAQQDILLDTPIPYQIWGQELMEQGAIEQMAMAMRLPISVAGALMPDAHVGYGLPIGGVLATEHTVIPFAVGVDIACRMRLSIYDASPCLLDQTQDVFASALRRETAFGVGAQWRGKQRAEHAVLEDTAWNATGLLKSLHENAVQQLGTSGTGNHFVEWGALTLNEPLCDLQPGKYLALLSHSGSRSVGFKIAERYSKLAMELHPTLDKSVRHLAWLDLDSEAGQEYWLSMELAGRFSAANHAIIHQRVAAAAGLEEAAAVENHHNFAWRETLANSKEVVVHRKGATPAGAGVLGVIPGSMGDLGYVVRGRGVSAALNSASHGAGRIMSRKVAMNSISKSERDVYLRERGVSLLGGGLDEAPQAYKPIATVMAAQQDLVDIMGSFKPRIVKMAN